jgi:cell division protein FtsB
MTQVYEKGVLRLLIYFDYKLIIAFRFSAALISIQTDRKAQTQQIEKERQRRESLLKTLENL